MNRSVRIRLTGLAGLGGENKATIERYTGYSLEKEGNDWVVYDDDPALRAPQKDVLSLHSDGLSLGSASAIAEIASECLGFLNPAFEAVDQEKPSNISVSSNLGLISELEQARQFYFWEKTHHLAATLVGEVIPRMVKLGAKRVYPIRVNSEGFYSKIALAKISYLNRHHGLEIAQDKVLNERILEAALPSPIEPLQNLNALLFLSPYAFALPLERVGSALLFAPERTWQFPNILTSNIFDQIDSTNDVFGTNKLTFLFLGRETSWRLVRQFIQLAVASINNLLRYFSDPVNFLAENGEFDELRLIKAHSLLRLMIADVKAINATSSHHGKSRLTFQFIDKIANLIVEMQPTKAASRKREETLAAQHFYRAEIFDELITILGYHGRQKDRRLGDLLTKAISRVATTTRDDIQAVFKKAGEPDSNDRRIEYFRILRNLGHGTFLDRKQFEELFLKLNPVIPTEFTYLPWLVLLALGLAPDRVLSAGRA